MLDQEQVATERIEHVLPRPYGVGIAHAQRHPGLHGAHDVGDQPVPAPVTSADHVAGARGGHPGRVLSGEERPPVGGREELGAGLGARVRIAAAERIALDEPSRRPRGVLVALVRSHDHDRAHALARDADRVEHVCGAHHVDFVCPQRILERPPDDRLACQVQHDLGV